MLRNVPRVQQVGLLLRSVHQFAKSALKVGWRRESDKVVLRAEKVDTKEQKVVLSVKSVKMASMLTVSD
jgi:hypothetical protein